MRIILIGTSYPMRGGMAHYLALLYRKLKDRGHDVWIISFKRQYPSFLFPGKTQKDLSKEAIVVPGEPLLDSIGPMSWIRTFFRIRYYKPDLVIFNYWMPFFMPGYATVAFLARVFTSAKVQFLCHNIVPHEGRPGDRLLTWIGLKTANSFIVQSGSVLQDLLRFRANAPHRLVPLPVFEAFAARTDREGARRKLGLFKDEKVVLFFGYIRRYKGLLLLIQAFQMLKGTVAAKLIVAGEFYDDDAEYRKEISDRALEQEVLLFDEYIPNEEVGIYFMAADVVVLPYLSATQSGILQIAYNFDRPVVVTNVGGLAESVSDGKTGFVVPSGDANALAEALEMFFRTAETVDYSANVREYKKQFSWDRLAVAIEELSQE